MSGGPSEGLRAPPWLPSQVRRPGGARSFRLMNHVSVVNSIARAGAPPAQRRAFGSHVAPLVSRSCRSVPPGDGALPDYSRGSPIRKVLVSRDPVDATSTARLAMWLPVLARRPYHPYGDASAVVPRSAGCKHQAQVLVSRDSVGATPTGSMAPRLLSYAAGRAAPAVLARPAAVALYRAAPG